MEVCSAQGSVWRRVRLVGVWVGVVERVVVGHPKV